MNDTHIYPHYAYFELNLDTVCLLCSQHAHLNVKISSCISVVMHLVTTLFKIIKIIYYLFIYLIFTIKYQQD